MSITPACRDEVRFTYLAIERFVSEDFVQTLFCEQQFQRRTFFQSGSQWWEIRSISFESTCLLRPRVFNKDTPLGLSEFSGYGQKLFRPKLARQPNQVRSDKVACLAKLCPNSGLLKLGTPGTQPWVSRGHVHVCTKAQEKKEEHLPKANLFDGSTGEEKNIRHVQTKLQVVKHIEKGATFRPSVVACRKHEVLM